MIDGQQSNPGLNLQSDIQALQRKWGVSEEELRNAVAQVGFDIAKIEEYLVNQKWSPHASDRNAFQKRDLNEDETY